MNSNFPEIPRLMTQERAKEIRALYEKGHSSRGIAERCHDLWGGDACWMPKSNQLAGEELKHYAQFMLGDRFIV